MGREDNSLLDISAIKNQKKGGKVLELNDSESSPKITFETDHKVRHNQTFREALTTKAHYL